MSAVSVPAGADHPRTLSRRARAKLARIPRAGRWCLLIAFLNAAVWGVLVPPFQVVDEVAHFAYAQYVAEHGHPPALRANAPVYSPQEVTALQAILFQPVIGNPNARGVITQQQQAAFRRAMAAPGSPDGQGGTTSISPEPPLYYYLVSVPYWISPWHSILARLAVMRLLSALLAAATVLVVFMFLRELMPDHPWTWTVGALMVAFEPVVNDIAAGVQADNLLFTVSALSFYCLVRGYRRGFTRRRAVLLGLVIAAGLLTKLTYLGLAPGLALGVLVLAERSRRREGARQAVGLAVLCGFCAVLPVVAYIVADDLFWGRGASYFVGALISNSTNPAGQPVVVGWKETLEYIWLFYLPRLWFMHFKFLHGYPLVDVWAYGFIGRFGYLDYTFPAWVLDAGYGVLAAIFLAGGAGLFRLRRTLRAHLGLVAACLVAIGGLLFEIAYQGVRYFETSNAQFEQTRYLFPLLVFYGLLCALAARAFPRRWGPAVGAALVLLAMAHGLFAETLTLTRYYG